MKTPIKYSQYYEVDGKTLQINPNISFYFYIDQYRSIDMRFGYPQWFSNHLYE